MTIDHDSRVWYLSNKDIWEQGDITEKNGGILTVRLVKSRRVVTVRQEHVFPVNKIDTKKVNDLSILDYLHEASVSNALIKRYEDDLIYTRTGATLVALNPFKMIDGLYDHVQTKMYHEHLEDQEPHIYGVIEKAYRDLCENRGNSQVLMVSGESGAGKTESAKYVMHYLCDISLDKRADVSKSLIESTNPILEAFGNAQTVKNKNSSRFGKFMRLQFSCDNKIIGAKIDAYLLEKVRVTSVAPSERNYHVFYQMISGLEDEILEDLYLDKKLKYLGDFKKTKQDRLNWGATLNALQRFGFNDDQMYQIFRILAGILLLGNVEFNSDDENNAVILNSDIIEEISDIMKINAPKLADTLCHNNMIIRGEQMKQKLSVQKAYAARDTLVRDIYEGLFLFLVQWLNKKIDNSEDEVKFIGILDIFGFEKMEHNRLEQLCINYTNECLQHQLNSLTFDELLREYRDEDITIPDISCPDNTPMINYISSGTNSIFNLLVDECHLPKGNDANLVNKLIRSHDEHDPGKCDGHPSNKRVTIKHYAGEVTYEFDGFCQRNSKKWNMGLSEMMKESDLDILKTIQSNLVKPKSNSTVVGEFNSQLNDLLALINETDQHFIRCIKPNDESVANNACQIKVLDQLRAGGVVEAIRISRMGYPIRMLQSEFTKRYRILVPSATPGAECVASHLGLNLGDYAIGRTKIFMNKNSYNPLEERRRKLLMESSIVLQSRIRMVTIKSWYDQKIERERLEQESAAMKVIKRLLPFIKWKLTNKNKFPVPNSVDSELMEEVGAEPIAQFDYNGFRIKPRKSPRSGFITKTLKRKLKIAGALVGSHASMVGVGLLVGILCL